MEQNLDRIQISLPNANAVLALGIFSIPACCCYGVGIAPAIIALFLAKAAKKQYFDEPEKFIPGSYQNLNTGNTCAWIGLVISIISLVSWIVYIVFFTMNSQFREQMQEIMKQYQA